MVFLQEELTLAGVIRLSLDLLQEGWQDTGKC